MEQRELLTSLRSEDWHQIRHASTRSVVQASVKRFRRYPGKPGVSTYLKNITFLLFPQKEPKILGIVRFSCSLICNTRSLRCRFSLINKSAPQRQKLSTGDFLHFACFAQTYNTTSNAIRRFLLAKLRSRSQIPNPKLILL